MTGGRTYATGFPNLRGVGSLPSISLRDFAAEPETVPTKRSEGQRPTGLPRRITSAWLSGLAIPADFHASLSAYLDEDALLNAAVPA